METRKEERAAVLQNLEAVLDDDEVLVRAADLRALCRDVDALEEALRDLRSWAHYVPGPESPAEAKARAVLEPKL